MEARKQAVEELALRTAPTLRRKQQKLSKYKQSLHGTKEETPEEPVRHFSGVTHKSTKMSQKHGKT